MTTPVRTKIGKYDVVSVIGRGGMGIVYKATDPHLGRAVAIKMMTGAFAENPDILKRFFREAQSLGSLQHPNIVTVYDLGDYDGSPYLVMQYLEGESLDAVLSSRRQLSLLDKITLIVQVCHGLSYAHRHGVVHRDIKPANIMLAKDGGVKIFDFGIAHVHHQNVTRTGQVVGTLSYMAPEQVNAQPIDGRSDLFSTGVVLYQLFTNHLPFEGENTATTLLKIVNEPPPPLANFLSTYPPEMEQILLRALAKKPEDRYGSADEFALDLAQLQGQLKQELISHEMQEVALYLDRGEVSKAQDSLLRVLKIDQHQTNATRLLREVQQRIQREEIGKQVRGLQESSEDALSHEQFDQALEQVERALGLDPNNIALQELRESIRAASEGAEKLNHSLKAAEAAHAEGKLDAAMQAAEEALELAPEDAHTRALHRTISRDIAERSRQRQMEGYLFEARQEMSSRKFTAALEILKQAEALDPVAPQVHSLIESAVAGREQERRRRELEAITHEVEDALNRDDYQAACSKADEGLARFPEERNLLKLKALSDRQRQIEGRKQFIDEQLAAARKLLQEGRNEELQESLEKAIAKIGPEPRLESLMSVVRENVRRERLERRKIQCLQKAKQSLRDQAFDDAIHELEAMQREMIDDLEIQEQLARVRKAKDAAVQGDLWRAQQESVLDLRVKLLEEALRKNPQERELKDQLHDARDLGQLISKFAGEARDLEEAQQYDQALAKWEALRSAYRHYPDLEDIIKRVRDLRERAQSGVRKSWIEKIEYALNAYDSPRASTLIQEAIQKFPWDSDLLELQERAEVGIRMRTKAEKMLAEGRKSFADQQWEQGATIIVRAYQLATKDTFIRDLAVSELLRASQPAMEMRWQAAETILRRLSEIDPGAPGLKDLQSKVQEHKREEAIGRAVEAAERRQANGDLPGALRELTQVLGSYPGDPRLREVQDALKERLPLTGVAARSKKEKEEKEAIVQDAKPKDARLPQELRTAAHQKKQEREDDGRERNLGVEQIRALASPPSAEHPSEKTGSPAASIFVPEAPLPTAHDVAAPTASPLAVTMAQTSDLATESANVAAIFSAAPNPSLHGSPAHPAIGPNLVQPDIVGPTGINFSAGTRSKEADIHRASVPSAPTHISPVLAGYKLNEASLRMIEKQFAAFIGPVAKVLVKRATSKTNSPEELYTILAASLESEADRKAFLARRAELAQPDLASLEASPPKIAAPGLVSKDELTAAVIETAARKLAAYLGPIALVLAKKEAKQTDSLRSFHQNLAAHLESDGERARFLNETGFGDRIIEPSSRREEASSVRHSEQLKKERLEEHIAPPPQAETPQQSEESEKPNPARKAS